MARRAGVLVECFDNVIKCLSQLSKVTCNILRYICCCTKAGLVSDIVLSGSFSVMSASK